MKMFYTSDPKKGDKPVNSPKHAGVFYTITEGDCPKGYRETLEQKAAKKPAKKVSKKAGK